MDKLLSMQELLDQYGTGDNAILVGNYLDTLKDYFANGLLDKNYFTEEPDFSRLNKRDVCSLVGLFEYYSDKFNCPHPAWMNKVKYTLEDPYFPGGIKYPKLRMLLMCESPTQFKRRNIFISSNGAERV